jgi:hypothetical protein
MVKITKAKNLTDEIKRENYLQAIEKVASTDQLGKLVKLTKDKSMIAMLDSFSI